MVFNFLGLILYPSYCVELAYAVLGISIICSYEQLLYVIDL
jgi:hypothetical protein